MRPLDNITVLDLTRYLPGAVATATLARYGAKVIKVEEPGVGDPARNLVGGNSFFAETNRGKKSIAINLKDARGSELLRHLSVEADILVESFRPGVMKRLGIDYAVLSEINPRLIYASLTGYRDGEPIMQRAGHDINYMALCGALDLLIDSRSPILPEIQFADLTGSLQLLIGILLALQARQVSGHGQKVSISMTNGMRTLLTVPLAVLRKEDRKIMRGGEMLSGAYACYNIYQAADGRLLALGALEHQFWSNLCRKLNREDLIDDQFASDPRQSEIKLELAKVFKSRTAEQWFEVLGTHDCCLTPVCTLAEALNSKVVDFSEPEVKLHSTPEQDLPIAPPGVGQDSREVLQAIGVSESRLRLLEEAAVIQSCS